MKTVFVPIASGSEPDLVEIDDCDEAVGDFDDCNICADSPHGQHEFTAADQFRFCIHCGEEIA